MSQLILGDCLEEMAGLADASVDLIATDPPYYRVKSGHWDQQWDSPDTFLRWLDSVLAECGRLLRSNGSLYLFASPAMAARVECLVGRRFVVLNCIRWVKDAGWHRRSDPKQLRSYLSPWEACIFAEHYGADSHAKGAAGYGRKCEELRGFVFEPLRAYLADEWLRAGLKFAEANDACGTASMAARHYFYRSQWCLPTAEHYAALQLYANRKGGEYLRREYEDLRREYEDLRRPFNTDKSGTVVDVWDFKTVSPSNGKHPCQKPLDLMLHMVAMSSRPGSLVFDPFMGSGTTGVACIKTGREFIGIEKEPQYFALAKNRIGAAEVEARQQELLE